MSSLQVEWLCRRCHRIKDRKLNAVVDEEAYPPMAVSADRTDVESG